KVATFEQLHHHVRRAVVERADVGHPADVFAAQLRGRTSLAEKSPYHRLVAAELREQKLQRHALAEVHVPAGNDDAHAALTDHPIDPELSGDDIPDGEHRTSLASTRTSFNVGGGQVPATDRCVSGSPPVR